VFEIRVLRKTFGLKMAEVTEDVACMGELRNAYNILGGLPEQKRQLG
jgi:hypothetical protein